MLTSDAKLECRDGVLFSDGRQVVDLRSTADEKALVEAAFKDWSDILWMSSSVLATLPIDQGEALAWLITDVAVNHLALMRIPFDVERSDHGPLLTIRAGGQSAIEQAATRIAELQMCLVFDVFQMIYSGGAAAMVLGNLLHLGGLDLVDPNAPMLLPHEMCHADHQEARIRGVPRALHGRASPVCGSGRQRLLKLGLDNYGAGHSFDEVAAYGVSVRCGLEQAEKSGTLSAKERLWLQHSIDVGMEVAIRVGALYGQCLTQMRVGRAKPSFLQGFSASRAGISASENVDRVWARVEVQATARERNVIDIPLVESSEPSDPENLDLLISQCEWGRRVARAYLDRFRLAAKVVERMDMGSSDSPSPKHLSRVLLSMWSDPALDRDPTFEVPAWRDLVEEFNDRIGQMSDGTSQHTDGGVPIPDWTLGNDADRRTH